MIDFAEENELADIGDPPGFAALTGGGGGVEKVEIDASMSIGLYGVAASASAEFDHIQQEYAQYADTDCTKEGACGYRIAWSVGYRLHLLRQSSSESASNPTLVAFDAKLNNTQVHYAFEAFGLDCADVYNIAPVPGEFDPERFGPFSVVASGVAEQITAQSDKVVPVPVALYFGGDYAKLAFRKAQAVALAAHGRAQGWAKEAARKRAERLEVPLGTFDIAWRVFGTAGYAKAWLDTDTELSELEPFAQQAPDLPHAPAGLRPDAVTYPRTVLRCQVLDIDVATSVGYPGIEAGANAERKLIVYEVFRQHGKPKLARVGGIDYLGTELSGLIRLRGGYTKVATKAKGSYAAVAAEAALNGTSASFRLEHHGVSPAATKQLLTDIDPSNVPQTLASIAAVQTLLAEEEHHMPAVPSGVLTTPLGPAVDARLFSGARTIWWVQTYLARRRRLDFFRSWARRYGLDMQEVAAAYQFAGGDDKAPPSDAAVSGAKAWLDGVTRPPG
ncbi:MAG: hypothetical protein ACOZNI_19955 [Myxococcota bacterium]